ncbi:MAG: fructosamine kinase family protein [Clostridia bacterium]|nr:fructosamine kinase family protein [Clostridia bacterium]
MEAKAKNPVTKAQAKAYAQTVLQKNLSCSVREISFIGGGSFGFVYKAVTDTEPSCRIMKACLTPGMAEKEAFALKLLGQDTLIKIPEVYFTFRATKDVPLDFICMEFVPGKNCFTDFSQLFKSKAAKREFADAVTSAIYHWHCRTNERFGPIEDAHYETWLDFYKPFAFEILTSARALAQAGKLEKKVLSAMENAWAAFDSIFSEEVSQASLIHGDLNVMNIMADKKLTPVAVIDPLESKWADKEYELFQLRNLTGDRFGLYETYKAKYPVSRNCDLKTAFYGLYHEVYCYIVSGNKVNFILMPLVRRMNKILRSR